jgi:alkanesulfonate monooxygenase SsuD/methylene tetrahydromethanopterin reductase-like flavin-dependent oxidoreductase (luciferase family)
MRIGLTLPQFQTDAEAAFESARLAEDVGIDGVFVFDHLFPIRHPERPALQSRALLGALAVETKRIVLGPLVARVAMLSNAVLAHEMETLHRMLDARFVAGLGTGDSLSRPENEWAGVPFASVRERVGALEDCCRRLSAVGVRTWVGGHLPSVRAVAAKEADGWNGWSTGAHDFAHSAADVRERAAAAGRQVELTWGGQVLIGNDRSEAAEKLTRYGTRPGLVHGTIDDLRRHFAALAAERVTWAVCAPLDVGTDPAVVEMVAEARDGHE